MADVMSAGWVAMLDGSTVYVLLRGNLERENVRAKKGKQDDGEIKQQRQNFLSGIGRHEGAL